MSLSERRQNGLGMPLGEHARELSRRSFIAFGGATAFAVLAGAGSFGLAGCKSEAGEALFHGKRKVVDHADREVTIPTPQAIERVYFTSALAQVFVFSLMPDVLAGTGIRFTDRELEFLPEGFGSLPYMGSLSGAGEIDREALIASDVQLIFSISGIRLTAANISEAQKLQDQTGIPVLCVDGSFDRIAEAYRFLGDIFGLEKRAEELATYLERVYADVTRAVAQVPEGGKTTLYYAEGPLGLQTEPDVSQHALTFEIAGAANVAAVEENQGLGMSNVSLEQVIGWDPEVIIAWDAVVRGGADRIIRSDGNWGVVRAVRDGRVYTMPNVPFAWCDRPPGVNRFIGIQWVANMLYPDLYDVDMVEVTQEFYRTMYWCDVSVDEALAILGNSYPPRGHPARYTPSGEGQSRAAGAQGDTLNARVGGAD